MVWITCGLLCCFYHLFGLSFWRHPFTAEDPLVSKWCNVEFLQICSDEETTRWTVPLICWKVLFDSLFYSWLYPFILVSQNKLYRMPHASVCCQSIAEMRRMHAAHQGQFIRRQTAVIQWISIQLECMSFTNFFTFTAHCMFVHWLFWLNWWCFTTRMLCTCSV